MWKDLFGLSFHRLQSWIGWQPIAGEMLWLGIAEPLAQWMPRLHKVKLVTTLISGMKSSTSLG